MPLQAITTGVKLYGGRKHKARVKDKYQEELNHVVLLMECGLCCLGGGFAAPAAGAVWPHKKRRRHVVQRLMAENCMLASKINKGCVEKKPT